MGKVLESCIVLGNGVVTQKRLKLQNIQTKYFPWDSKKANFLFTF